MFADHPEVSEKPARFLYPSIICMLWVAFFALFIGNRGVWSPDEPRYMQVAWEMARSHHFLVPIFNGEIYSEKPPLYFWLAIGMAKLVGFEASTRWVSALAGLGTLLLTYGIGARLVDRKTGLVAALILMTCGLYAWLLTTGNIDMLLTLFVTASIYAFVRHKLKGGAAWLVTAYVACGFAILSKGPVGFLLPWLLFVAWTVHEAVSGEKPAWWHLLWGLPVALVPVAAWLVPAIITGGEEYARTILIKQNVGRAVQSFAHAKPWYSYFLDLPVIALPWTLAFIGIIPETVRAIRKKDRAMLFFVFWLAVIFIFFTIISGKRSRYLVPLMPAVALMTAHGLIRLENRSLRTVFLHLAGALIAVVLVAFVSFPVLQPFLTEHFEELRIFDTVAGWRIGAFYLEMALAAAALVLGYKMALRRSMSHEIYAFSVAFLLLFAGMQLYVVPAVDHVKSARYASVLAKSLMPPDGRAAFYGGRYTDGWNFYLDQPVIPEVDAQALQTRAYGVVIGEKKHSRDVVKKAPYVIAREIQVGGDLFYLFVPERDATR